MQEGIKSDKMQKYFDSASWDGSQDFPPWLCNVQYVGIANKADL